MGKQFPAITEIQQGLFAWLVVYIRTFRQENMTPNDLSGNRLNSCNLGKQMHLQSQLQAVVNSVLRGVIVIDSILFAVQDGIVPR